MASAVHLASAVTEKSNSVVSTAEFQRWQRLWVDNTAKHGRPKPDQSKDNQSQSESYSSKLF